MDNKKEGLTGIVGAGFVMDDPGVLETYSKDQSFVLPIKPSLVVRPGSTAEVQKVVAWANETGTPLVPVSSGPPHFHGDTVPSVPGAVMVDLGRMNRVLRVDRRHRMAVVEPGVTWSQLAPELAKEGLEVTPPLLPRKNKSVIGSLLERQPTTVPRYQYSLIEPLRNCGVVWGSGEISYTGEAGGSSYSLDEQWAKGERQQDPKGPAQTDFVRFVAGAQGAMGIVVWASVRCQLVPDARKLFFVTARKLDDLLDLCRWVQRLRLGDEVFLANGAQVAGMVGSTAEEIRRLKSALPPWVLVIGLGGRAFYAQERVEVQEKDLSDLVQRHGLTLEEGLSGITHAQTAAAVRGLSRDTDWKLKEKGAASDIFFLTTLEKTPRLVDAMFTTAAVHNYPSSEIGVYIQPQHQGVEHHCEFTLPYSPTDRNETSKVRDLFTKASEELSRQGAYFSRPYGMWAALAYNKDAQSAAALRKVKRIFDPRNVMNRGKLCF